MFKNYLKTAFRNLTRQRSSALFNIGGLTLAVSSSIILFLFVSHVTSYDTFHANYKHIYRVVTQSEGNEEKFYTPGVPTPLPVAFRNEFAEAEQVVFTHYISDGVVSVPQGNSNSLKFQEKDGIVYTEPSFFKIFTRSTLAGDAQQGLDEPNEAVISRSLALKYFNKVDVVGEVLTFDNKDYKVSAVVADFTNNTDFPFSLFLSFETIRKQTEERGGVESRAMINVIF